MKFTIDRLRQIEIAIEKVRSDSSILIVMKTLGYDTQELEKGKKLLQDSVELYHASKSLSNQEYEAYSLVYTAKSELSALYHKHLRLIKPILNNSPKFWRNLEESERNAKGISGWLNQIKAFYNMLLTDQRYKTILQENSIDLNELNSGRILIQGLFEASQKQQKCSWENRMLSNRLKRSFNDLELWKPEFNNALQLINHRTNNTINLSI